VGTTSPQKETTMRPFNIGVLAVWAICAAVTLGAHLADRASVGEALLIVVIVTLGLGLEWQGARHQRRP